jgi:hypothetical protein
MDGDSVASTGVYTDGSKNDNNVANKAVLYLWF